MKEKITLFIALSFLVGLTVYKKSFDTTVEFANSIPAQSNEDVVEENLTNNNVVETNNEIDPSNCKTNELDTDQLQFSEAFKYYRNCNHDIFIWKGTEYTAILKTEINDGLEKNHESVNDKLDLVAK